MIIFELILKRKRVKILSWNTLKISDKFNKIWLKKLNSRIFKDERLNWSKFKKKN